MLEIAVLGPLSIRRDGEEVAVSGARRRAVLLRLLVAAGHSVRPENLIEDVWEGEPPAHAVSTLQSHISFLRKVLGASAISYTAGGYRLGLDEIEVDSRKFDAEVAAARAELATGDPVVAERLFSTALERWRGLPLADVSGAMWATPEISRLEEERLAGIEGRLDALLVSGRHAEVIPAGEAAVAENPLRERLWGQLMLALYRSGRQADALRAFQRLRLHLADELGLEPSADLLALDEAIVRRDAHLEWTSTAKGGSRSLPPARERTTEEAPVRIPLPSRLLSRARAPFVGRADELRSLTHSWKESREGVRQVVFLAGEPGIGKTSLARVFGDRIHEEGAIVLYGRCEEDLAVPYKPWVEALGHLARHGPAELFEGMVPTRIAEAARLLPELADRCGVDVSQSVADESERYLLFGAVIDLLRRCSELAPTALVLDDLHWADRPTIALLHHLVGADTELRLLVLGTYRDSDLGVGQPLTNALAELHRETGVRRVTLKGLGDDQLLELLENFERDQLPPGGGDGLVLRNALLEETGGNPFFVGEILRHLSETAAAAHGNGQRELLAPDLSRLPVSVREVVGHRVGRLGRTATEWLTMAAVIGRDFDIDLLAAVVRVDDEDLLTVLEAAVKAGILVEGEEPGRFSFAHALFEHSLYRDLSALRRARAHRSVAEAIEDEHDGDPGTCVNELAYHWARATEPQEARKAIRYAQLAGDRALHQLAPDEAARWYSEALEMLERQSPEDVELRAQLMVGLGDAQRQAGDPGHRETLLRAAHLAHEAGDKDTLVRAALANNRGFHSSTGSGDAERVEVIRLALDCLGEGDSEARARLLAILSVETLHFLQFEERLELAEAAVACARRVGDPLTLADVLVRSHEAISMPETLDVRRAWVDEACDLVPPAQRFLRWLVQGVRAIVALESADFPSLREALGTFDTEAKAIGQPLCRWINCIYQSWNQILLGDLERAEQLANEAFTLGNEASQPDALLLYGAQLFDIRFCQGRVGEMLPITEQLVRDYGEEPVAYRALQCLAAGESGDLNLTTELLDRDMAGGFEVYKNAAWLTSHVAWAVAASRAGHVAAARTLYDRLVPWDRQIPTISITAGLGCVARSLGLLAHLLKDLDAADSWFAEALQIDESMESPLHVAWTKASWARMLVDRGRPGDHEMGRAMADEALDVARRLGFPRVEGEATLVLATLA